jgi:hypothetical protein
MLASERADPDRPRLDAFDRQDRLHPRVVREPSPHLLLALGADDEERRSDLGISERPAENDNAVCRQPVDERGVLAPAVLRTPRPRVIPLGPGTCVTTKNAAIA